MHFHRHNEIIGKSVFFKRQFSKWVITREMWFLMDLDDSYSKQGQELDEQCKWGRTWQCSWRRRWHFGIYMEFGMFLQQYYVYCKELLFCKEIEILWVLFFSDIQEWRCSGWFYDRKDNNERFKVQRISSELCCWGWYLWGLWIPGWGRRGSEQMSRFCKMGIWQGHGYWVWKRRDKPRLSLPKNRSWSLNFIITPL